jgi:hypothetical protein
MRRLSVAAWMISAGCFADAPPLMGGSESSTTTDATDTTNATTAATEGPSGDAGTLDAGTSESAADTSGPSMCSAEEECVALPDDWMGPFARAQVVPGETAPDCVGPYDQPYGVPLHEGLVAGELDCDCSCETISSDVPCLADLAKYETDTMCSDPLSSAGQNQMPNVCTPISSVLVTSVGYELVAGTEPMPPVCGAERGTPSAQPSTWQSDVALCGLNEPASACTDGACVPLAPAMFDNVCILRAGEHECPGDFADEHLVHVDAVDQRSCDDCECDAVTGDCTPVVYVATDLGCDDYDDGTEGCADTSVMGALATFWLPTDAPACEPSQVVSGAVVGTGPHTMCCRG